MNEFTQYPDILGMLSQERLTLEDVLQCALGIFPATTALDQPVEALLLLQNLTNQPLPIQIAVRTPSRDDEGGLVNIFTPKPRMTFALPAGESGLLHIPLTPQLPTRPNNSYAAQISLNVRKPDTFVQVRPLSGGSQPSLLALSPFRIAVLREVKFTAQTAEPNQLGTAFDVLPGRFPASNEPPQPRYEALWTLRELAQEEGQAKSLAAEALSFANSLSRAALSERLYERTKLVFGEAGMPLHPGEITFITKTLVYVMEDGLDLEAGFSKAEAHWFMRLCRLMAQDQGVINNLDRLIPLLYTAVVHDAGLMGLRMVIHDTGSDFGDIFEQTDYVTRMVEALENKSPLGLEHVYVPLVMAGVILHGRIVLPKEKQWRSLNQLEEARDGRISLAGEGFAEVFNILNTLIERAVRLLTETHVPRK